MIWHGLSIRRFGCGLALWAATAMVCPAQETPVTLVNGAPVDGKVLGVSEAGLQMQVGTATRTYPWFSLSPGTRYRYDQTYRMNLSGYLAGKDPSSLTNPPDPTYDPMNPAASVPDEVSPSNGQAKKGFALVYDETTPEVTPVGVPALSVLSVQDHSFFMLQYGPSAREAALFGYTKATPPDLLVYDMKDSRVSNEKAATRAVGGADYHAFPGKAFSASFGAIASDVSVQCLALASDPARRFVVAEVNLARGGESSAFTLSGIPGAAVPGTKSGTVRPLFAEPAMSFTLLLEGGKVVLAGRVRVGRLSLSPRSGMDLKAEIEVLDATGRSLLKKSMPFDANIAPDGFPWRIELPGLDAGATFKVVASMSLGPFLGNLTHEELFVMPDAQKL